MKTEARQGLSGKDTALCLWPTLHVCPKQGASLAYSYQCIQENICIVFSTVTQLIISCDLLMLLLSVYTRLAFLPDHVPIYCDYSGFFLSIRCILDDYSAMIL